jgi:SAM-dependent methyltransferase
VRQQPWSHNLHYHRVILGAVPAGCGRALDVGCGTGALTRRLRRVVPAVTGIDRDGRSIALAVSHPGAGDISYLHGDFLAWPFEERTFGLVTSVASLHHMDAERALASMRALLRPGGVLAVVGLARGHAPADLGLELPAVIGTRLHLAADRARHGRPDAETYHPPVVWPPATTYADIRRLAARLLPGARYRRHLYWRYSLVWTSPA